MAGTGETALDAARRLARQLVDERREHAAAVAGLRADIVAALRAEAVDLGCVGLPEFDHLSNVLDALANRIDSAGQAAADG